MDSEKDVVHGIEKDPGELLDGFEKYINKYGNQANVPNRVAKERTDAATTAIIDLQRKDK